MTENAPATHLRTDLSIDQQLALKTAATRLQNGFRRVVRRGDHRTLPAFVIRTVRDTARRSRTSCRCWRNALRASGFARSPGSRASTTTANPPCCSSVRTTRVGHRWRWASSRTWPAMRRWPGPGLGARRRRQSRGRPGDGGTWASTSRTNTPSPGPMRSCKPPTSIVTMGCGDACPVFPGRRYEDWVLDDPAGRDVDAVRPIRDEIERRVRQLLADLQVPTHA